MGRYEITIVENCSYAPNLGYSVPTTEETGVLDDMSKLKEIATRPIRISG